MGRAYDVHLIDPDDATDDLGLSLAAPKRIETTWAGITTPQTVDWSDFKNGFGYSRPGIVDDGYAYGLNVDPTSPGLVMPAGKLTEVDISALSNVGHISDSFALAGSVYFLAGRTMIKVLSGYSTVSTAGDAGVGQTFITATVAAYAGTPYAWLGVTDGMAKWDGTTLTKTTSFVRNRMGSVYWATTDGVSVQRLVATDTNTSIKHCPLTSDPMVGANWTASITVGEGVHGIAWLASAGRHIFLATEGGVYDVDDLGQTILLTPYVEPDVFNGGQALYHDGVILVALADAVDAVDVSQVGRKQETFSFALPGGAIGIPNETPLWGRITAFAPSLDRGWVVGALWNGTDSYIVYGKRRARLGFPGPGEWVWHGALAKFASQQVTNLRIRSVTQGTVRSRRLWISTRPSDLTTIATRLYWQSLPLSPSSKQDFDVSGSHQVSTTFTFYTTPADFDDASSLKRGLRVDSACLGLGATSNLAFYPVTDGTTGATLGSSSTSPVDTITIGDDDAPTGRQIGLKIDGTGSASSLAAIPQLLSVSLEASVDAPLEEVLTMQATFERGQYLGTGAADENATPETDRLRLALKQGTIQLYQDPLGNRNYALVEEIGPGALVEANDSTEENRGWNRTEQVRLRITHRPALYDNGVLYDADAPYDT